jgi:signal transduction histidine kinase
VPLLKGQLEFVQQAPLAEPVPVLLDFGDLEAIDRDAREFAAVILSPRWNKEVACVCHNPVQRVIASFFKGLNKIRVPLAITGTKEEGIAWLQGIESGEEPQAAEEKPGDPLDVIVDAVCGMASGDFGVELGLSERHDVMDAVASGISMLAEETGRLLEHRRRAEGELVVLNDRLIAMISERERIADELQMINTELDGFAHTVTHDLKGPLAAIGASSHLLMHLMDLPRTREFESEIREVLNVLLRNVEKADALIEDTLTLAEAGQAPSVLCTVDVSGVVARVLEERAADIEERQVRAFVDSDLGTVFANPTQIYQVFSNLIGNAIVHNDSPEPVVEVRLLGGGEENVKMYMVKDNGSGIPSDQLETLFNPFSRGPNGSTGVGLSIVSRILDVYGGDIAVRNDGGARFDVVLRDFDSDDVPKPSYL